MACEWIENKKSAVWKHFQSKSDVKEEQQKLVRCKVCPKTFHNITSTSSLRYHAENVHHKKVEESTMQKLPKEGPQSSTSRESKSKQSFIRRAFSKQLKSSAAMRIARIAAIDRFSFSQIANSVDLRDGLEALDLSIPTTRQGIRSRVVEYGELAKEKVKNELKRRKESGEGFSLCLDECMSAKTRRYMGINVHAKDGRHFGLGMKRIIGSMPADRAAEILKEKLLDFGLGLKADIFGLTTNGASVMKKMGHILPVEHQICHAHGVHLGVTDVLYKKKDFLKEFEDEHRAEVHNENYSESEDSENDEALEEVLEAVTVEESSDIHDVIKKVRKVAQMFKKKVLSKDQLQEYCEDIGHELNLQLDCRTRWNSLLLMLQKFVTLRPKILETMIILEIPQENFLTESETQLITSIVNVLDAVETASKALCREDINLSTADTIFEFFLSDIDQTTSFGEELFQSIKTRIEETRRPELLCLLTYLSDPNSLDNLHRLENPGRTWKCYYSKYYYL